MVDLRPDSSIADGVHWIKHGFVNSYVIENGDELILVDTAMNKKAKKIFEYIKKELSDKKVAKIYITHHHTDHTGGLKHLQEEFHPRIYASEEDKPVITGMEKPPGPNKWYLKPIFFILSPFFNAKPVETVEIIEDGMEMDGLKIYHLPGHTMGSMGFMKNGVLLSGDAAVEKSGEVRAGVNAFCESEKAAYASLRKVSEMSFDAILPGHGQPILEDADQRVKEAVERLEE